MLNVTNNLNAKLFDSKYTGTILGKKDENGLKLFSHNII